MKFRGLICKDIIFPLGDILTRQRIMSLFDFYSRAQWWDRERLCQIQNKYLRKVVATAYKEVPFYEEYYNANNVNVDDVREVKDLVRLPIVTKDVLRKYYPERCTRPTRWPISECYTSGSSGKPFGVKIDNLTHSHARALMFLRAEFSGWNIGDSFLQFGMTGERGVVKRIKDILLGTEYMLAYDLSDESLDKCLEVLETKRLKFLMGYPGSIFCLAKRAQEVGFSTKMRGIVTWGDNLYNFYRTTIEKQFGCKITDTYGCGEGIQIAAQCEKGIYHTFMPHLAVEVVDADGFPVKAGEIGNILLTRLNAGVMPLIRYKIGDIGRKAYATKCECGRGLESLLSIDGRDSDIIITPSGNRLIVHFFTGIFEYYTSVDTFQIVQESPCEITVKIVPRPNFELNHWEKIKRQILERGDRDLKIKMELVEDISLPDSNKRRFVVSRVKKQV